MNKRTLVAACAATAVLALGWAPLLAHAQSTRPIKIALIASKTGPSQAYDRDTERGLRLGLEYITQGSMIVHGHKIALIFKDDQMKPDRSKAMLAEAFGDEHADIAVGTSWSGGALAMVPISAEYTRVLMLEPAIARC